MRENYVATLFKEVVINNDTYLFIPIHVIEGKYAHEAKMFIDGLENAYYDIEEAHIGLSNCTEFYGFATPLEEICRYFDEQDKKQALQNYFETMCQNIYIGTVDHDTGDLKIISIPLENIKSVSSASKQYNEPEDEEPSVKVFLNEEGLNKLLSMETIDEIKEYLTRALNFTREVNEAASSLLEEDKRTNDVPIMVPNSNLDVRDMYNYITSKVINQDDAVRKILMTFIMNNVSVNSAFLTNVQPTRTLIIGPSASGKTLILETIIEYLEKYTEFNIPIVKVPTSQLTSAGYVGMNLEDILEELVSKVTVTNQLSERIKFAERNGVVFLDEIDKKGSKDNGDVAGRSVLNALLQFLDGANYQIFSGSKYSAELNTSPSYFNTKHLNIFASGAFTHVKDDINKIRIGFNNEKVDGITNLSSNDCITKGDMPLEFIGRFHQTVNLKPLNFEDLKDILNKSIASPILIEKQKLELIGLNLTWDASFIEEVAKKAYNLKLGARSLKTIIEEALSEIKWQALLTCKETNVLVSSETVENPKQYRII